MGTEPALRDELRELRLRSVRADRGGVHFEGSLTDGMRACFHSRVAQRILLELAAFDAPNEDALYEGVRSVTWAEHLSTKTSFAVRASSKKSALTHTQFLAQLVKDAVVDQFREEQGQRPDVSRDDPDVLLSLHLAQNQATLYLDLAGDALFARGYRTRHDGAPLKETLAAALVRMSGWDQQSPFIDPMCGSGTVVIEAALLAAAVAPGLMKKQKFGFQRWASFGASEAAALQSIRERASEAHEKKKGALPRIVGRDVAASAIEVTRENAGRAGVTLELVQADIAVAIPEGAWTMVVNPPYGDRMSLTPKLLSSFGAMVERNSNPKKGGEGSSSVLCGTPELLEAIPSRPSKLVRIMNGDIECRFASYGERKPA